jgi:acyl-homoserine lactone acylase PvdQ
MYKKEEASQLRQEFWIAFGKYMKPIFSAEGLPINWVNYKTGVKHVFFKMITEQRLTQISIVINHKEKSKRDEFFAQFLALKVMLKDALQEDWEWQEQIDGEYGQQIAQISISLKHLNIFNKADWPAIISFLKPRIIALDQFWVDVKPIFEEL